MLFSFSSQLTTALILYLSMLVHSHVAQKRELCLEDGFLQGLQNDLDALPFCSTYLGIPLATRTARTVTPTLTSVVTIATTRVGTVVIKGVTTHTVTKTVISPYAHKRDFSAIPRRSAPVLDYANLARQTDAPNFTSIQSALSSACSCLGVTPSTKVVVATASPTVRTLTAFNINSTITTQSEIFSVTELVTITVAALSSSSSAPKVSTNLPAASISGIVPTNGANRTLFTSVLPLSSSDSTSLSGNIFLTTRTGQFTSTLAINSTASLTAVFNSTSAFATIPLISSAVGLPTTAAVDPTASSTGLIANCSSAVPTTAASNATPAVSSPATVNSTAALPTTVFVNSTAALTMTALLNRTASLTTIVSVDSTVALPTTAAVNTTAALTTSDLSDTTAAFTTTVIPSDTPVISATFAFNTSAAHPSPTGGLNATGTINSSTGISASTSVPTDSTDGFRTTVVANATAALTSSASLNTTTALPTTVFINYTTVLTAPGLINTTNPLPTTVVLNSTTALPATFVLNTTATVPPTVHIISTAAPISTGMFNTTTALSTTIPVTSTTDLPATDALPTNSGGFNVTVTSNSGRGLGLTTPSVLSLSIALSTATVLNETVKLSTSTSGSIVTGNFGSSSQLSSSTIVVISPTAALPTSVSINSADILPTTAASDSTAVLPTTSTGLNATFPSDSNPTGLLPPTSIAINSTVPLSTFSSASVLANTGTKHPTDTTNCGSSGISAIATSVAVLPTSPSPLTVVSKTSLTKITATGMGSSMNTTLTVAVPTATDSSVPTATAPNEVCIATTPVQNGGFENSNGTQSPGWQNAYTGTAIKFTNGEGSDTNPVHSGSRQALVSTTSNTDSATILQTIPICPGVTYDFSAWVRTPDSESGCDAIFVIGGAIVGSKIGAATGTDYEQVAGIYGPLRTATSADMIIYVDCSSVGSFSGLGQVYLDDISLTAQVPDVALSAV